MKKYLFLPALAALLLSGCATKPVNLPTGFWQQPAAVTVVIPEPPKQGDFVMQGNQGLLDVAIAAVVTKEVRTATKKVDSSAFNAVAEEFAAELKKSSHPCNILSARPQKGELPRRSNVASGEFDLDLTKLNLPAGTRYVLWLELLNYGALRTYYAFIPTSAPSGFAAVRGRLVDMTNHKVLWDTGTVFPDGIIQEPVAGEWKQPPDYANLVIASNRAIERSRQYLVDRFFETRPATIQAAPANP